ncbi:unnamed protein product [Lampetra fluviatilis]
MAAKATRQRPARVKAALGDPFHLAWPLLDETLGEELVEELREALGAAGLGRGKGRHGDAGGRKRRAKRGDGASERRKATGEKMEGEGLKGGDEKIEVGGRAECAMVDNRGASVDDDSTEMKEKAVDEDSVNRTGEGKTDNTQASRMDKAKSADDANEEVHAKVVSDETSGDAGLSAGPRRGGWSDASVRREVALGVNEVIRGLERDELSLVLVCGTARPPLLPRLLASLCASRAVSAAQLGALSAAVAPLLGLRSVLALGVRRDAPKLAKAAEIIGRRLPPLRAPWLLSGEAAGAGTGADVAVGACRLMPSNVKKIVSNPARRKRKRS